MSVSGSGTAPRLGEILTLAEAAEYLRVDERALAKLAAERRVPSQKIGEEWRFLRKALDDWLRYPSDNCRDVLLPWMLASPFIEEWMSVLEERLLGKLKAVASPLYKRGSKQAVLSHFGVFKDDDDLEEQLANLRARREAT
jgi:excisionase family DNA binding protein